MLIFVVFWHFYTLKTKKKSHLNHKKEIKKFVNVVKSIEKFLKYAIMILEY